MAKSYKIIGFCKGAQRSMIWNRKMIFIVHQVLCRCVNYYTLQPTGYRKLVFIGKLSTGLKRFHKKYRRIHVLSFIGGAPSERNLEIFAAIVKLVMLFYAILDFSHLTHNPTLLASRDGLQTDNIEKMVNMSKI